MQSRRKHASPARTRRHPPAPGIRAAAFLAILFTLQAGCSGGEDRRASDPATDLAPAPAFRRTWLVMGTTATLSIWETDPDRARRALEAVRDGLARVDSLMSTYRESSDISRVNRSAGEPEPVSVDTSIVTVLRGSRHIARLSGGRLDPTAGPLVALWSFYEPWQGEEGRLPSRGAVDSARTLLGQEELVIRRDPPGVRLPREGMRLDLGAVAKGYALDRAAAAVESLGTGPALLQLGGQMQMVGPAPGGGVWEIGVHHPREPGGLAAVIRVPGGALTTSGDYERFFVVEGERYAHIIDPSTGWPTRGVLSVTVWAPTGLEADGWSTALFVAGPEEGRELIAPLEGIGAVWIMDPGEGRSPGPGDIRVAGSLDGRVTIQMR